MDLISFYKDGGMDHAGRTHTDILSFDDDQLEHVHDYIQWLFPLPEQSQFQPHVPVLTGEDIQAFKSQPAMQDNMRQSFHRLLAFYGFRDTGETLELTENFNERVQNWLTPMNHNFLRITRILRSLTLLGLDEEAKRFFDTLDKLYQAPGAKEMIGNSHRYWKAQIPDPNL